MGGVIAAAVADVDAPLCQQVLDIVSPF